MTGFVEAKAESVIGVPSGLWLRRPKMMAGVPKTPLDKAEVLVEPLVPSPVRVA